MKIEILTLFPDIFAGFLGSSLIGKAITRGSLSINLTQIRDFASPPHYQVDDSPYGGGAGMVMKPEPLIAAIADAKTRLPNAHVVVLSPSGKRFSQSAAETFAAAQEVILVCGRYEGIDERVISLSNATEISIGDYVLMGGEVPAMVIVEAIARLRDEVIGNPDSLASESFSQDPNQVEAPQYTRPPEFQGLKVPEVLLSGNHGAISEWRKKEALAKTARNRPDLVPGAGL